MAKSFAARKLEQIIVPLKKLGASSRDISGALISGTKIIYVHTAPEDLEHTTFRFQDGSWLILDERTGEWTATNPESEAAHV